MAPRTPGAVYGVAGGSVGDGSWAHNDKAKTWGEKGEVKTGALLDEHCRQLGGPTVLHDLIFKSGGWTVNIDHIVVSSTTVQIVDSKMWRACKYSNRRGKQRQGKKKIDYLDSKSCQMARDHLEKVLATAGVKARVVTPVVVVWPSSKEGRLDVRSWRPPGARAMTGAQFQKKLRRTVGCRPADPAVVAVLATMVYDKSA